MVAPNVFAALNDPLFSAISMSRAIDKLDYIPQFLASYPGLFEPDPVRTEAIWIEERPTGAVILPFSPRGSPPHTTGGDARVARAFQTLRYGNSSRVSASELLGIRAWNSEINMKDLQTEVARRQQKMKNNMQLTKEYHLFNCVTQAKVKDADGTLRYDWAVEFEQPIPAEVDFDLDNPAPTKPRAIFRKSTEIRRGIQIGLKGVGTAREIIGLCGNAFWDDLTGSAEVEKTYLNQAAANDLRNDVGNEWSTFRYGNIVYINYRGTDDGAFGVPTDKCFFFPVGAGIFRIAYSPGERFEHLGQLGQETYSAMVLDEARDSWADVEAYSYPLPVCVMPGALASARRT